MNTNKGFITTRIPIFIITHDRLQPLIESIKSYHANISSPFEIILHDNISTYQPLKNFLSHWDKNLNGAVFYNQSNELNDIKYSIQTYYENTNCVSNYYVVTDPDVCLFDTNKDILEFYKFILMSNKNIDVVGPMLEIDDIPNKYGLKDLVIKEHKTKYWNKTPAKVNWNDNLFEIQYDKIDTTFGLYRKSFTFSRLNNGVRTRKPYTARHLDWYIDTNNLTHEQKYYMHSGSKWGNWSSHALMSEDILRTISNIKSNCADTITNKSNSHETVYSSINGMSLIINFN